ncbi:MAG: arylsulfatase [Planctomycetota bacterium]
MCLSAAACSQGPEERPPNIVFILVDDLGVGDLSCYGQTRWQTPRLDRMADEGMRFTAAYAGSTVCAPSRAALLTGFHTGRLHMRGNGKVALRPDPLDVTIATRLRGLGYATAMVGKSSVACNSADAELPHAKGFDEFYGILAHAAAHRHYPRTIVANAETIALDGNEGFTGAQYASELFVDRAIEWMAERSADRPFFLHLSITAPHADLIAPERFVAPFRGRWPETPHTTSGYYHQAEPLAAYAGMVSFVDDSVGRVLDALTELGIDEDTVVFFASDNGPHGEGGADPDALDSNGSLRGGKRAMFEGGIRTPQIVRWPGRIAPGSTSDLPTAFWDFPATALELAAGGPLEETDGLSIVPTLLADGSPQREHAYLYWEFHEQGGKQAVRMGEWKGIRRNVRARSDRPIELYHLPTDPGERSDVAEDHPAVVARIEAAMAEAHEPSDRFRWGK